MRTYSDEARLTLGELSVWTRTPTSELQAVERCGVIARGPDGLFPILETTNRLADYLEAENARFRAGHRLTSKGWVMLLWEGPARALGWALRPFIGRGPGLTHANQSPPPGAPLPGDPPSRPPTSQLPPGPPRLPPGSPRPKPEPRPHQLRTP
jgi:hypothetical protein